VRGEGRSLRLRGLGVGGDSSSPSGPSGSRLLSAGHSWSARARDAGEGRLPTAAGFFHCLQRAAGAAAGPKGEGEVRLGC